MKVLLTLTLLFMTVPCHAGFKEWVKGIISPEFSALKTQVSGDINGVKADVQKLADVQVKMNNKMDTALNGIAGVNNTISKSQTSAGRDIVNESAIMSEYIASLKASHTELVDVMWKIITLLIVQLVGLVGAFGGYMFFTIKSLLNARDEGDKKENALLEQALKHKGE